MAREARILATGVGQLHCKALRGIEWVDSHPAAS